MSEVWDEIMTDASLGDVTFPLRRRAVSGGRDFARISPPHQPGQRVADTGRKALVFKLEVPLFNGVEGRDDLYPTVYEELLDVATSDDAKGEVEYIDPILGAFAVKVTEWSDDHDPDRRDGCTMAFTLEEITEDAFGFIVPARSPGREVIEAAAALDEALADVGVSDEAVAEAFKSSGYPKQGDEKTWPAGRTFESLATDFRDGLETGLVYADRVATEVDRTRARVRGVLELGALRTTAGWPAMAEALRLVDAAGALAERAVARAVPVIDYRVLGVMSVYDVAVELYGDPSRADEILARNRIATPLAIRAGSVLRVAVR